MNIRTLRDIFFPTATLSLLTIDGIQAGFVCEDVDRWLNQTDTLDHISAVKVKGQTAIPVGRYRVGLRNSPKHGKDTLYLQDVPGFQFIDVHAGNSSADTEGCLLVGLQREPATMRVLQSRYALDLIRSRILPAMGQRVEVWWQIDRMGGL